MESKRKQELLVRAEKLYNSHKHRESLVALEEVIDIDAKEFHAFFLMGNIFHLKGEISKAIKAFNKVLELSPNHTDASVCLSVLLNDIGQYAKAQEIFNKASENVKKNNHGVVDPHVNKKFARKHFDLAEMYYSYNRYDEAIFEYNKSIGLDPENLEVRVKVAKAYSKKGFISKAFDELKKIKRENPGYIHARVSIGLLYYSNGNVLEAQTEWQNALSLDPYNKELKMYLDLSKGATETNLFEADTPNQPALNEVQAVDMSNQPQLH